MSAPPVASAPAGPASGIRLGWWTLCALLPLLAWDATGWDLPLARLFGNHAGFALQEDWFLVEVMHEGAKRAAWLVLLLILLSVWWPWGVLRRISRAERVQWVVTVLLSLLVVSGLKRLSSTSCPWDLAEFGGVAHYASHWVWGVLDGGGGKCFPAGHASTGFAFIGGFFALRRQAPTAARYCLAAALAAGLALGWAQQLRGAHFASHTLWTGWLCWATAWLVDGLAQRWALMRHARLG